MNLLAWVRHVSRIYIPKDDSKQYRRYRSFVNYSFLYGLESSDALVYVQLKQFARVELIRIINNEGRKSDFRRATSKRHGCSTTKSCKRGGLSAFKWKTRIELNAIFTCAVPRFELFLFSPSWQFLIKETKNAHQMDDYRHYRWPLIWFGRNNNGANGDSFRNKYLYKK